MTITPPENIGCAWPVDQGCIAEEWEEISPTVREYAVHLASAQMEALTGGRVTNCPITVAPCQDDSGCWGVYYDYSSGSPYVPYNFAGRWFNTCSVPCEVQCGVDLEGPIGRVDEIIIDNEVQLLGEFAIIDGRRIVWTGDGPCPIPSRQDLANPSFTITYLRGYPVDRQGSRAMTILAMEFAKACTKGMKCQLPRHVVSVVRSGVTYEVDQNLFETGRTGIQLVDAYLALWVPEGYTPRSRSRVMTPSTRRPSQVRPL